MHTTLIAPPSSPGSGSRFLTSVVSTAVAHECHVFCENGAFGIVSGDTYAEALSKGQEAGRLLTSGAPRSFPEVL